MSLRTLRCHENSSFYKPSLQNKLAFTSSKNALIMNITRSNKPTTQNNFALTQRRKRAYSYYEYSSFYEPTKQNNLALTKSRNMLIFTKRGPTTSANSNCYQFS